jgi:hypothetical protein
MNFGFKFANLEGILVIAKGRPVLSAIDPGVREPKGYCTKVVCLDVDASAS